MNTLTKIKRLALALCFVTPLVSRAATDYSGTAYEPWSYSTVYVWRVPANSAITDLAFSTFAPVASDGTVGEAVTQTGNAYLSWAADKTGYVAPGKVLCYDATGYKASIDSTFTPLSFGGLKVDALADETAGTPYTIVGSGTRYTDFGYTGHSTYFEFNKSFTVNRSSATRCYGAVTIQVAQDATFKSQASLWAEVGGTVKLTGEGTVELPSGLYVNNNSTSTLDLSAATRPTITGNVTVYEGGAIALPAGTEPSEETPFTVCSGTLTVGTYNYVKIGDADPISATLTVSGGAITGIEPYSLERTFTSDYPTVVPAGAVFTFQGGTEDEPVVLDARIVNGTLKTEGYFSFTSYAAGTSSTLEVVSGKVTLDPGDNWFRGTLTVEAGATFVNAMEADAVQYDGTFTANIYGTLDMGATRWSLGSNNTLNFHEGCTVTGSGQSSNGTFDWIENATANLNVSGDVAINAPIRIRSGATVNVTVDAGANNGLTLNGSTIGVGTIVKKGAGLIKFTTNPGYAITCQNGSFTFSVDATPTITYPALPTSSTSMWYAKQSTWKGTVVINAQTSVNGSVPLATWGTANSKIVLKGLSGSSCYFGQNADTEVQANVQIDGNVTFNQGWSGKQYILDKVTGTDADVTLSLNTASGMTSMNYTIQTLDFAGTIALVGGSTKQAGCNYQFTIGNIVKAETPLPGTKIVKLTRTVGTGFTDTITVNLDSTTLNGEAADLEVKEDGIYVVVPATTVDITIPEVANATVSVTADGVAVTPVNGVVTVDIGAAVVVTYTAAEGYTIANGTIEFTAAADTTTVDTTSVTVSEYIAWIYDENGAQVGNPYTTIIDAMQAFNTTGNSIRFKTSIESDYAFIHAALLNDCNYDSETFTYTRKPSVAKVTSGMQEYLFTSLVDAVTNAISGDTVTLLADVTLTDKLVVSNKTVTITADSAKTITGQLRVVDGSNVTIGENVTITSDKHPTVFVLGDPAVKTAGTAKSTLVVNGTVLNTNAGFDQTFAIAGNGLDTKGVDITINGTVRNANGIAIYQAFPGNLVVNGTVEGASAISIKDGTLTVNDGAAITATLTDGHAYVGNGNGDSPTGDAIIAPYYPLSKGYGTPVVSILGGTITVADTANCTGIEAYDFEGTTAPQDAATNVNVEGGLFNTPVAKVYCASGYIPCEVTGGYSVKVQMIDPTDPTSTQEVTVDTETYTTEEEQKTAAIAAATVAIPAGVSGVDAAIYKTYFTYSATPTATAGTYTVAITGFADEVTETADGNALAALEAATAGTALGTITVKPGLYYGTAAGADVTTLKAPAGELNTTGKLSLSGVTKPSTGEAFFIKIKVGATAFAAEE